MKRAISILLALALTLALAACGGKDSGEDGGGSRNRTSRYFDTPEDVAKYYIDCIRAGDVEGALAAYPIQEKVDNADFVRYAKALKHVMILPAWLPPAEKYSYYKGLAKEAARTIAVDEIRSFTYALTDIGKIVKASAMITENRLGDELGLDSWDDLAAQYDPERAEKLQYKEMLDTLTSVYSETDLEIYQKHIAEQMERDYGDAPEEWASKIVICEADETYLCRMRFIKFPKGWKLWTIYETFFLGLPTTAPLAPISDSELRTLLDDHVWPL